MEFLVKQLGGEKAESKAKIKMRNKQ